MADLAVAFPTCDDGPAVSRLGEFDRAVIRCLESDIGAVSSLLGVTLPRAACSSTSVGALNALWLGPDEWLLLRRPPESWNALVNALSGALSFVDVSHRQVAFCIKGQRAELILASSCALDLTLSAFPVGMCTRTTFAKAEIVLWRTAPMIFHLEVWRSFADYVEALLNAAESERI